MEPEQLDDYVRRAAAELGVAIEDGDVAVLLDLARDAAHGVARPAAPLTAYLAGLAVGSGRSLEDAVAALRTVIGGEQR
ncbi:DUF6457 domain-containing protein [uncultured Leifsonia sp.]|uniref:DUF6457 domain-containing protein n=1 Tax=uncultured Leifsonia sp. TaxID=340359 RepID=UPI0028D574BE|nr:DUF6457 domain-containing protein [uncultured Leifsonia sp.]